jgi:hypothetical protein
VVEAPGLSQKAAGMETMVLLALYLLLKTTNGTGRMAPLVETGNMIQTQKLQEAGLIVMDSLLLAPGR